MSQPIDQPPHHHIAVDNGAARTPLPIVALRAATDEADDTAVRIRGYAAATSVNVGDQIDFHVSLAQAQRYTVTIYRVGHYDGAGARQVLTSPPLTGVTQPGPSIDPGTGLTTADWSVGWTLPVPPEWTSGLYIAQFTLDGADPDSAADGRGATSFTPFVVRDDSRRAGVCVVVPFVSLQANNLWPRDGATGKSLYHGYRDGEPSVRDRAVKVSFDRPYDGDGLPRMLDHDVRAIAWAEEQGYDLTYVSDVDLHAGRVGLAHFSGAIVTGQGEYWSLPMRAAVADAVAAGTSIAFLSGGTMYWNVRLEPSAAGHADRSVVCYKTTPDPLARSGMATMKWRVREPGPGNAEQNLLGVQLGAVVASPSPLVVTNSDHWFWSGTGAREGSDIAGLVAGDVDRYDPRYGRPAGMPQTLLADSPVTTGGGADQIQNTSVCEAPDGTLVFVAGTTHWSDGLWGGQERDDRVRAATANLVARMLAPRGTQPTTAEDDHGAASARNPIATENRAAGSRAWRVGREDTRAVDERRPQIQGYASATSVALGSDLDFHVSVAEAGQFTVSIYRMGHYGGAGARLMLDSGALVGEAQPAERCDETTGRAECDWVASWRLDVPVDWTSGMYVAAFTTSSGYRSLTPFVVRDDASTASLCVVLPFLTYQAGNRWPLDGVHGSSLGHGYNPETGDNAMYKYRAVEVSFDRPYTRTGLPAPAYLDIDVIAWLERNGYDLTYVSNLDIHNGCADPGRFAGLVFIGQDEYWTTPLRDAITRATQSGTSLAFLGAGTCHWHARLEAALDGRADRVIACYKSDPDPGADVEAGMDATTRWRAARPGPDKPEQSLVGAQLLGRTAQPADLIVTNADHWVWDDTGVTAGMAIEGIVKGQVDEVDRGGVSPATGRATLLANSPFTLLGRDSIETQNTNICELANGAVIFAVGTESWPLGLVREISIDARIQIATRNVLDRMAAGPPEATEATASRITWTRPIRASQNAADRPVSPVTVENRRPGSRGWRIGAGGTKAGDDITRQIAGYASATSVDLGESIDFHVSVNPAGPFTVAIYRLGYYRGDGARLLTTSPPLQGSTGGDPYTDPEIRSITCDWPVSWTLRVPSDWTSGLYYAVFTSDAGFRAVTPFVVRDSSQRDNLCVIMPFTTYQAYNQWPLDGATGRDLYRGYVPGSTSTHLDRRSYVVSFDRPYFRNGQPSRIEFDLAFIRWAEEANFDLSYATSIDLHAGRIDPTQYAGLLFPGHDEYWSAQMREHAEAALAHGTSLAFFEANNVYWHIRVGDAPDGRQHRNVICYKHESDPDPGPTGVTIRWRSRRPAPWMPEQLLLGVQYNGIVARPTPLIVQEPDHWFWAGTGVEKGEAIEDIVGGEADGYDARYGSPEGTVMLAHSPYELSGGGRAVQNTCVYETAEGAVVFASGSNDWPAALGLNGHLDRRIHRATANLLDHMLAPRLDARATQIEHLKAVLDALELDSLVPDTPVPDTLAPDTPGPGTSVPDVAGDGPVDDASAHDASARAAAESALRPDAAEAPPAPAASRAPVTTSGSATLRRAWKKVLRGLRAR